MCAPAVLKPWLWCCGSCWGRCSFAASLAMDSDDEWLDELLRPEKDTAPYHPAGFYLLRAAQRHDPSHLCHFATSLIFQVCCVCGFALALCGGGTLAWLIVHILGSQVPQHEDVSLCPLVTVRKGCGPERPASTNYWKCLVPAPLHDLKALGDIMNAVLAEQAVRVEVLPKTVLASKILSHANAVIRAVPENIVFKIGITTHPVHRRNNPDFGYKHSLFPQWDCLKILAIMQHGESAGIFEASLIETWAGHPCCLNEAGGGESVLKLSGPSFVYVVVASTSSALRCLRESASHK